MRLIIATIGRWKTGNKLAPEQILYERYASRIRSSIELREIEEKKKYKANTLKKREGELLISQVPDGAVIVALDEEGIALSSMAFANKMANWSFDGKKCIVFMIGGPDGLDKIIKERASLVLSLGNLTWPHLLVRGMLAEQIYRTECILNRHPYHRG
jgi:23S rRNA (pseudouridine1915-N3)-methyltransferase|tara:strand:- start:183 stop:653 length:471 start_codon:yes stop_codon:yes gene_type:complete